MITIIFLAVVIPGFILMNISGPDSGYKNENFE
jgi:hypothetical protein